MSQPSADVLPTLTISEVAHEAGVAVSAVRFYEKHGLIDSVRTAANQRRFFPGAVCRIEVARLAQRVGLTVREIVERMARMPQEPSGSDWAEFSESLVAEARSRIASLEATLAELGSGERMCEIEQRLDGR